MLTAQLNGWTLYRSAPWHQTSKEDNFSVSGTVTKLFTSNSNKTFAVQHVLGRVKNVSCWKETVCVLWGRSGQVGGCTSQSCVLLGVPTLSRWGCSLLILPGLDSPSSLLKLFKKESGNQRWKTPCFVRDRLIINQRWMKHVYFLTVVCMKRRGATSWLLQGNKSFWAFYFYLQKPACLVKCIQ